MPNHPDPAWVDIGRACYALVSDSGLPEDDRIQALTFAQQLVFHPAAPAAPKFLNADARNPDPNRVTALNPYGGKDPVP